MHWTILQQHFHLYLWARYNSCFKIYFTSLLAIVQYCLLIVSFQLATDDLSFQVTILKTTEKILKYILLKRTKQIVFRVGPKVTVRTTFGLARTSLSGRWELGTDLVAGLDEGWLRGGQLGRHGGWTFFLLFLLGRCLGAAGQRQSDHRSRLPVF